MPRVKKSISAAQRKKDPKAGPHGSFPLDAKHLKAAWDLAGQAKNPDAIRRKVLAFARQHNMEHLLPDTAKEHLQKSRDVVDAFLAKASSDDMSSMYNMIFDTSYDDYPKRQAIRHADDRGMLHLLPESAHSMMHDMNVGHNHDGMENDEDGTHQHPVTKAYNPVTFDGTIMKAWGGEDGSDVFYEGWLSTPKRDLQKDIIEPEAFLPSLPGYFQRSAPVSVVHDQKTLPAGHLMKAAIIRDGKTLLTCDHPSDSGNFGHLPDHGSGVWVLGRLTEEPAKGSVRKGNCGGMSFIGNGVEFTPLTGGGKRYTKINPMMESTVAPYPVNTDAYMAVIKSFGLSAPEEESRETMNEDEFRDMLAELLAGADTQAKETKAAETKEPEVQKAAFTPEQFEAAVAKAVEAALPAQVAKAFDAMRAQPGVGKQSTIKKATDPRDDDPVAYVLSKSSKLVGHDELEIEDKDFIAELTKKALFQDLRD